MQDNRLASRDDVKEEVRFESSKLSKYRTNHHSYLGTFHGNSDVA